MKSLKLELMGAGCEVNDSNPRVYIGRDGNTCELVGAHPTLSRRHAEVFVHGDGTYIRDLGSSNGTWVNGHPVGQQAVTLEKGQQVYIGHVPLGIEWIGGDGGRTMMVTDIPPELKALMEARKVQLATQGAAPPPMSSRPPSTSQGPASAQLAAVGAAQQSGGLGVGGTVAPLPAEYAYRRQGSNNNGTLLIALKGDTYSNDQVAEGFLEFTATDNETVASIVVDLVEFHKKGPKKGHVWDRVLVRQGPWKARKGDVAPMPFQLRIPTGTSMSSRDVHWEIRGYVDINWALDIEASSPITMRNMDVERIRDALGALDYRIVEMDSLPMGQRYVGKFQPPAHLAKQLGISNINLALEYMGTNLKINMHLDKRLKFDKKIEFVFDLQRLRGAQLTEITQHFLQHINQMMA